MRTLFFLLLLANVAFFAYSQYGAELFSGESNLLAQQINPRAIRLLAPEQVAKAAQARRTAACLEWGAFVGGDAARAEEALALLALGARLSQRRVDERANYWVFMPPQGSRQAAAVKTGELKRLGIEDFFVVQEDPNFRFAISLGVFRTEEAARNRLEQLQAKGVRTAQVAAREMALQKIWFQVRDVPDALAAKLNELRQSLPGSERKVCAPEEKQG